MPAPFQARYSGLCDPCGEDIIPGEYLIAHPEKGYIHEGCAVDVNRPEPAESNGADFDSFNRGRGPIAVLPRGKTAKDRCDKCFIIHTPGQDGCE